MNKQIGKNMFDGMELPEQAKQEVWGNLESIISNTTVEKRVHKNRVWVRRLGKTAAAFLIMGVLFGTINGVSHGGLVEAISGLWQTDESSQKIVTEMTDYHVRLDVRRKDLFLPEVLVLLFMTGKVSVWRLRLICRKSKVITSMPIHCRLGF